MVIRWFEESASAIPLDDRWLSPSEVERLAAFRIAKRRNDWRLGRWVAKCAVTASIDSAHSLAEIEIRTRSSGAPEAICPGEPLRCSISISHRDGVACCAIAPGILALGCDLERVEMRSPAFLSSYFTPDEEEQFRGLPREEESAVATLLWSAKESALKALNTGLRVDTRTVSVRAEGIGEPGRHRFNTRFSDGELYGWWTIYGGFVRTVACSREFAVQVG